MKKKIIITLIVLAVVICAAAGGIYAYKRHQLKSGSVDVIPVANFVGGWWGSYQSIDGNITANGEQSVRVTGDSVIEEILVTPGQAVTAGDVLLRYDTTLLELQMETQKTNIDVISTSIQVAERDLEDIKKIVPIEDMPVTEEPSTEPPTVEEPVTEDPLATPGDADEITEPEPAPEPEPEPMPEEDMEPTYTRAEKAQMITDKENEIRDLKLQKQMAELEYKRMEINLDEGEVICTMDGVVKTVDDSEENIAAGNPVVVVSGEGGYNATVMVDEWSLADISKGLTVQVYSYETGMYYEGTVVGISDIPNENYYIDSTLSYYPVEVAVHDADDDMYEGMYVSVTMEGEDIYGQSDDIVMHRMYIREENGNHYVMKEENGVLKKQYVTIGKIYYGEQIEIKSGLSPEDWIAFPYGKNAVEGKKTVHNEEYY